MVTRRLLASSDVAWQRGLETPVFSKSAERTARHGTAGHSTVRLLITQDIRGVAVLQPTGRSHTESPQQWHLFGEAFIIYVAIMI